MKNNRRESDRVAKPESITCGLIMPISALDGCAEEHWSEVKAIIIEAIEDIDDKSFSVKLVSEADDVGVIQKRIVQNVYSSDVIVCDVSGKNPNVMFELGLRLAFDKPTVIIKDDKTDYSFDTAIIEHVTYPRDLHFHKMVAFKAALAVKVQASHTAAKSDPNYSPFLKNFGKFHVASLNEETIPVDKFIIETLSEMRLEMTRLRASVTRDSENSGRRSLRDAMEGRLRIREELARYAVEHPDVDFRSSLGELTEVFEKRCNARQFFRGPYEFNEALQAEVDRLTGRSMTTESNQSPS